MPPAERSGELPLALCVLHEELGALGSRFEALAQAPDRGERDARRGDLLRALDRYLRLEQEVFHPILERQGIEHAGARASNERLRRSVQELLQAPEPGTGALEPLRAALRQHGQVQEQDTFPRAAAALGEELPGLALELEEVRSRMKGAFGV